MLARGFVDEVKALLAAGHGEAKPMASVGYKEVRAMLRGDLASDALRDAIVQSTRVFARRQRTWLRNAAVEWL